MPLPVEVTGRPLFLAPHYDDVALSCGGTIAHFSDRGSQPLILTVFGGKPEGPLNHFAQEMHGLWGVGPDDAIDVRRAEEMRAAKILGADFSWLDFSDAIYRNEHYLSDEQLFGLVHEHEQDLPDQIECEVRRWLADNKITPGSVFVPLRLGNHVDHQHLFRVGQILANAGLTVFAFEDFPYASDPDIPSAVSLPGIEPDGSWTQYLSDDDLARRIEAILCYQSQLHVIFRHQGDPAEATDRYARIVGEGEPGERFWTLTSA